MTSTASSFVGGFEFAGFEFVGDRKRTGLGEHTTRCLIMRTGLRLDERLAHYNAALAPLQEFVLPGGTRSAALAHVSRTVARRAERAVVALAAAEAVNEAPRQYLNRLSDLMFVLARVLNRANLDGLGGDDVYWRSEKLARSEG